LCKRINVVFKFSLFNKIFMIAWSLQSHLINSYWILCFAI
jgi:hypothetical protein